MPWEKSKAFDGSALVGCWVNKNEIEDLDNIDFYLKKNEKIVQRGNTSNMLWKIDELVSEISNFFTLKIGDIIFTGTPAGVGKVNENDILVGFLNKKECFSIKIK
jgi:2-keto-4-pentenoate hydratase/2-oxohepta-3-ene-1,7-dioic acid hydratase in catechol pathway